MKRIIVIGCPGSGKSYFSKRLCRITKLPLVHLDNIWWKDENNHISRDEFDNVLKRILQNDKWIIDGNYSRTMEMRMKQCDTVIFLDYSSSDCLKAVFQREGKQRDDCPVTKVNAELINEIKDFSKENRSQIFQLIDKYSEKEIIVFHQRYQADNWLKKLRKRHR